MIELTCISKNSRLEGQKIITDILFGVAGTQNATHNKGAVIGVPTSQTLTVKSESLYNILSDNILITVSDVTEADKYKIGENYQLSIGVKENEHNQKTESSNKSTSKLPRNRKSNG